MPQKLSIAVIFGSRSVEHDVSIITGRQVIGALDRSKYDVVPIYIAEDGRWLTGPAVVEADLKEFKSRVAGLPGTVAAQIGPDPSRRDLIGREGGGLFGFGKSKPLPAIDVVFPCVHGTHGEDGTLQGLLELADVPYVGAGVVGAAVGMDKIIMKAAFAAAGIPCVRCSWFTKSRWEREPATVLDELEQSIGYPVYVKPANLGSSIGITRAADRNELEYAIEVASRYDRRLLVEQGLDDIVEVNCSVLGNDDPIPSVCEQPMRWQQLLSFEDKYLGGKTKGMSGQKRQIPAPISAELTAEVQRLAVAAFRAIDCAGIARIDFLVRPETGQIWVNEINTLPGSLSFYLWEPSGIPFPKLCDRLIELALERHREKKERVTSYDTVLLSQAGGRPKSEG